MAPNDGTGGGMGRLVVAGGAVPREERVDWVGICLRFADVEGCTGGRGAVAVSWTLMRWERAMGALRFCVAARAAQGSTALVCWLPEVGRNIDSPVTAWCA